MSTLFTFNQLYVLLMVGFAACVASENQSFFGAGQILNYCYSVINSTYLQYTLINWFSSINKTYSKHNHQAYIEQQNHLEKYILKQLLCWRVSSLSISWVIGPVLQGLLWIKFFKACYQSTCLLIYIAIVVIITLSKRETKFKWL